MENETISKELQYTTLYKDWLNEIKQTIRVSRMKVALAANAELILFYWNLGQDIAQKQSQNQWGNKLLDILAKDLKEEFPESSGFSRTNLYNCVQFYNFYNNSAIVQRSVGQLYVPDNEQNVIVQRSVAQLEEISEEAKDVIVQRSVGQLQTSDNKANNIFIQRYDSQIPWRHNVLIFTKTKDTKEAIFYIEKTVVNGWSSDILALQIKSGLYQRSGKTVSNFKTTLPDTTSELVEQTMKDPYRLDFITLAPKAKERDIENQLVNNITHFLLELGKGFAFVGRQYRIELGEKEYFIDLLFYHIILKCYVVIELKNKDFMPEHAGKLNFYLTLVDKVLKRNDDNPTVGILLCRGKDNLEVEYALQDIHKPIGVSEFTLEKMLPAELVSTLPTIEEFEEQLKKIDNE